MNKDRSVNIYDIAKKAGVSIATVSRVLNDSDKVSDKTRDKVNEVMKKMDYTPNAFAQGLGLNTMHTVGILVPTISDLYLATAVSYLVESLEEFKYDCLLSCSGFHTEKKEEQVQMLLSKHVDALILLGSTFSGRGEDPHDTDYIFEAARQVPVFLINANVEGDNIYASVFDDKEAIRDTTEKLIRQGRKEILFITDSRSYSAKKKLDGFKEALERNGREFHEEQMLHVPLHSRLVKEALQEMSDIRFDAAITTDDSIAIGVVKYALSLGLKVPEDIAVVGYNNSGLAIACEPEITSVDSQMKKVCGDTVRRLIDRLADPEADLPQKVVVSCKLIERGSTCFT